jgi:hypothetical protein
MMKRALRFAAAVLLLPLLPTLAGAFKPIGGVWKKQNANLFIGHLEYWWAWNVSDAARDWNHKTAFTFDIQGNGIEACDRFDSNVMRPPNDQPPTNGVEFNETMCGNFPFDPAVLAVTHYLIDDQGYFEAAGIVFNKKDWEWAVYDGPWREDRADFHRVALHELGHFLGLDHEDAVPSIMHTYVSEIDELQPDDIEGANALYAVAGGGAGGAPALDPVTACQVGQLKAASKLCKAQLGCEAKLARDPAKDPGGAHRDACQANAAARFEAAWDGAVAEAALSGGRRGAAGRHGRRQRPQRPHAADPAPQEERLALRRGPRGLEEERRLGERGQGHPLAPEGARALRGRRRQRDREGHRPGRDVPGRQSRHHRRRAREHGRQPGDRDLGAVGRAFRLPAAVLGRPPGDAGAGVSAAGRRATSRGA